MYYSNCLIECLRVWVMAPHYISIKKRGPWSQLKRGRFPHFYWKDDRTGHYYDFAREKAKYPKDTFCNQLFFKGFKRQLRYIGPIGMW